MRTARLIGRMTREQRDLLRNQIDVRMRERLGGQSKRGGSHVGHHRPQPHLPLGDARRVLRADAERARDARR